MTYIPQPTTVTEGSMVKVSVVDDNLQQIFADVLGELKKMNLQLQILSDNEIKDQEIG